MEPRDSTGVLYLPPFMYDSLERQGRDMSGYVRAEYVRAEQLPTKPKKPKIVRYVNREARRQAAKKRRNR